MNLFTAIYELTTFDHAACDAQIVSHGLHPMVVKAGSSFEGVSLGSAFIAVWSVVVVAQTVRAFRNRRNGSRTDRSWLWVGPVMCAFAAVSIVAQSRGVIEYADTCRSLLHLT